MPLQCCCYHEVRKNRDYREQAYILRFGLGGWLIDALRTADPQTTSGPENRRSSSPAAAVQAAGEGPGSQLIRVSISTLLVVVGGGYPIRYQKGFAVSGLDQVDALVFHAGTRVEAGRAVTNGGRV